MYIATTEQFNCSIFMPAPVLGGMKSYELSHETDHDTYHHVSIVAKQFLSSLFLYIFEPLYYQMCDFKCNCFIFILLNAF